MHSFLIQIGVLEGSHEQVYDCSSPDETDSEALDDYDNIDDIPDDLKQWYERLSILGESLTQAFEDKKTKIMEKSSNLP